MYFGASVRSVDNQMLIGVYSGRTRVRPYNQGDRKRREAPGSGASRSLLWCAGAGSVAHGAEEFVVG